MLRETDLFFETVVQEDRSILDFLDARFTFVNGRLAEHYGIDGVEGDEFRRVSLEDTQRAGVLTQASVLTITSDPTKTKPVLRGKWILENILGTPPPPPPPNVPDLEETTEANPEASLKEQLALHRTNPTCASCHNRMDPLGFGLENFNPIGRWRNKDGKHEIDASGKLPEGSEFGSPLELVEVLRQKHDQFARCFVEKLLTFALGRGLEYYDKCVVDEVIAKAKKDDYRFSSIAVAIAQSDAFRKRRGEEATK